MGLEATERGLQSRYRNPLCVAVHLSISHHRHRSRASLLGVPCCAASEPVRSLLQESRHHGRGNIALLDWWRSVLSRQLAATKQSLKGLAERYPLQRESRARRTSESRRGSKCPLLGTEEPSQACPPMSVDCGVSDLNAGCSFCAVRDPNRS